MTAIRRRRRGKKTAGGIDLVGLETRYYAGNPANVVDGSNNMTTLADVVNGRNIVNVGAAFVKQLNRINGKPSMTGAAGRYYSNLTIPLEGTYTFFIVMKYVAVGAYHTLVDTLATDGKAPFLWIADLNQIEVDATGDAALKNAGGTVPGIWKTVVVHGNAGLARKIRINGVQVGAGNAGGSATIPGAAGAAVNHAMSMFHRAGASSFQGEIADMGWYRFTKDGQEAALESFLRAEYATW